jgi:hypothetical protein
MFEYKCCGRHKVSNMSKRNYAESCDMIKKKEIHFEGVLQND